MAKGRRQNSRRNRMSGGADSAHGYGEAAYGPLSNQLSTLDHAQSPASNFLQARPPMNGGATGLNELVVPAGLLIANNYVRRSRHSKSRHSRSRHSRRNKTFRRKSRR
jgi:hypothetical protein